MKVCTTALLVACSVASATSYGRSKIQIEGYEWWTISSPRVDLYYPMGCEALAESVLAISSAELDELSAEFGFLPEHPVPVVAYPSPGSFRQTPIIDSEIDEAVGGFTEYFKGRVVVPFTGSWTEFRHVLTHEINHAYVFDMLYRRSLQDIILSTTPLWTIEGLAEYTSAGWDPASEAEFRDMIITGQIVSIEELSNRGDYLVYREGQAIYRFMVERYGIDRFHEFVRNIADRGGLPDAVEEAFDMSLAQFDARFQEWARETYWAQLATRENPSDLGRVIEDGDHGNLTQAVTVISRDGSMVAGVEGYRGGYSVVVRSAVTGEVIRRCVSSGGLSNTGISPAYRVCGFSPGGDSLAIAVHGVSSDMLLISTPGGTEELPFRMDLIRDPVWSPDGRAIAFCGMDGSAAATDVFVWDGGLPRRVTDTPDGERDISWSGSTILAASEEPGSGSWAVLRIDPGAAGGEPSFEVVHRETSEIRYPADTPEGIAFLGNPGGLPDLFLCDSTGAVRRLSNLYTSIDSPSWADSGRVLSFTSVSWPGYGVYLAYGVLDRIAQEPSPADPRDGSSNRTGAMQALVEEAPARTAPVEAVAGQPVRIAPYTPTLSTDYVSALAGYDSYSGFEGYTTFVFSDVLAHHQVVLNGNFNGPVEDADAAVYYTYMPDRADYGGYVFRESTQYLFRFPDDHLEQVRDVDTGGGAVVRYPFTMAVNALGGVDFRHITRDGVWNSDADYASDILSFFARFVVDTALWDHVGPRLGERLSVGVEAAPGWDGMVQYTTVSADLRKYVWMSSRSSLALRVAGASSWGSEPQRFLVGGAVPHRVMTGETEEFEDILGFYTNYGDMLRGLDYTELSGRNYVSTSVELRVPFVRTLSIDAPLPMTFSSIRGVIFADAGTAFDDPSSFVGVEADDGFRLEDIGMGFGFGFRANLGIFLLREDTAWATDLSGVSEKPVHYVSLGASF